MIKKIAHALTRKPKLVALIAVLLLIPSALGYIGTRVNYDILSYLPEDLDSVQGERLLEEPFHMAATSMLIVEGMPAAYTNDLINEIKEVPASPAPSGSATPLASRFPRISSPLPCGICSSPVIPP